MARTNRKANRVSLGQGTEPNPTGDGGAGGGTDSGEDTSKLPKTQAELTAMLAREKAQGRSAAANEFQSKLGGKSVDELIRIATEAQQRDLQNMTEAERAKTEAANTKAEADRLLAEAKATAHATQVQLALVEAKAKLPAKVAAMVTVEAGADAAAIKAAVEALKAELPELFAGEGDPAPTERKTRDSQTNARPPAGGQAPKSKLAAGREAAAALRPAGADKLPPLIPVR